MIVWNLYEPGVVIVELRRGARASLFEKAKVEGACVLCLLLKTFEVAPPAFSRSSKSYVMIVYCNFGKIEEYSEVVFMFSMCSLSRNSSLARAE